MILLFFEEKPLTNYDEIVIKPVFKLNFKKQ